MKDYRIEIKVKNNFLWRAMRQQGYETVAELCRAGGFDQASRASQIERKDKDDER